MLKRSLSVLALLVGLAGCGADTPTTPDTGVLVSEDLVVGTGATAVTGDVVTVHYIGTFTNGTKFDSSYDRGQPYTFPVNTGAVIPGFDQAVLGMKVGGKRRVTIPPSLAYGSAGQGTIPPNATLKFDIDLVSIQGK
ncbi:MAG: FKBP-type peptidyl-prolyl cis-trans isomerase [Solirubrobacterales bacterium]